MSTDVQKIYAGQDLRVDFVATDATGAPLDLTDGRVEVILERRGRKPFYARVTSEDPGAVQWWERAQGTGVLTVPLKDASIPYGFIRMNIRAVTSDGQDEIQYDGVAKVLRSLARV